MLKRHVERAFWLRIAGAIKAKIEQRCGVTFLTAF
jgi:hypothetical protein